MYDFVYNVVDKRIIIREDDEVVDAGMILAPDGFEFRLQRWCEKWLDERDLEDEEYRVFIRIH